MQNKPSPNFNPILVYLAVILLVLNAVFLGFLLFGKSKPVIPTKIATQNIVTAEIHNPTPQPTDITPPATITAPIRLAWFTSLPKQTEDLLTVANWFDVFFLIRGDEDTRDLIKSLGAEGPILQYVEFESIQDPGSCSEEPKVNQAASQPGDFCFISNQHPDWFLLDREGQRIVTTDQGNTWYLMDPGNQGWRNFFLERIRKFQSDPNWDGVFLDNVPISLAFREDEGSLPFAYPDDANYRGAIQGFLEFLHREYFEPNNKLLFANLTARRDDAGWIASLNFIDGAMYEGWAIDWPNGYRPAEVWERHLDLAEQTQLAGKYIILVSLGNRDDEALQKFAFASYLLINHGNAAFRYSNSNFYRETWLYDDYAIQLGNPINLRYKDGAVWRRDFENGSVSVDPMSHEVKIIIKP